MFKNNRKLYLLILIITSISLSYFVFGQENEVMKKDLSEKDLMNNQLQKIKQPLPKKQMEDISLITQQHNFFIFYTGNRRNNLEPCGCKKTKQLGGINYEAGFLNNAENKSKTQLKLDIGDTFLGSKSPNNILKSKYIAKYLGAMEFDAVNLGTYELRAGLDFIKEISTKYKVNFISSNIIDKSTNKLLFPPYKIFEKEIEGIRKPIKIAVIGVAYYLPPSSSSDKNTSKLQSFSIEDAMEGNFDVEKNRTIANNIKPNETEYNKINPKVESMNPTTNKPLNNNKKEWELLGSTDTVRKYVSELRDKVDIIILLAEISSQNANNLIKEVDGIDIFIMGTSPKGSAYPKKMKNTILITPGSSGSYISELMLKIDKDKQIEKSYGRIIEVYEDLPSDVGVFKILDEYKEETKELPVTSTPKSIPINQRYTGAVNCKTCHLDEYTSWSKTLHADAFKSLQLKKQEYDPECVSCHVTGYNVGNGFRSFKETPRMINVQCEQCHDAGFAHFSEMMRKKILVEKEQLDPLKNVPEQYIPKLKMTQAECMKCHDKANDDDFNYKRDMEIIKHWDKLQ